MTRQNRYIPVTKRPLLLKFVNNNCMKTNENWPEIVDTLRPYTNGSPAKGRRLKDIENCLRFLGWRKTNGTMSACTTPEENSGEPVIVLSKRDGRAGLQRFPVMTESPDSMAYTAGLYMGENIRLYYRPGEETDRPVCVLTVELRGMTPTVRFFVTCCPIRSSI